MSEESQAELPEEVAQKPMISLPFVIIVGVLAVGAYFAGPKIMTLVMLQDEAKKAQEIVEPDEYAPLSEMAKSLMANPGSKIEQMEIPSGGSGGGGGRGGFDPEERFASMDADGDGKLVGDEISDRLAENMDSFDADGNKEVTKEEFMAGFANRGGRGGRGRPAAEEPDSSEEPESPEASSDEATTEEPAEETPEEKKDEGDK